MLSVGVNREHVTDFRFCFQKIQSGQDRRTFAEVAGMTQNRNIRSRITVRKIQIRGPVVDDKHVRELSAGAGDHIADSRRVVVNRNDAEKFPEIHGVSPLLSLRSRA